MLDSLVMPSTPALLVFFFVVMAACCWLASVLSRKPFVEPFRNLPSRWFSLLDLLVLICFTAVVTAVSSLLVRFPSAALFP